MSGVGSTNAMKKGSANNPFLAYSEADMASFLNSAYTGCIVKYAGEPISRYLTEQNKTVPEHVKNLVFSPTDGGFWEFFSSGNMRIKIQQKTNGSTKTLYITPGRYYNRAWHFNKTDFTNGNLYLTDSLTAPTEIPIEIQKYFDTEPYWRWNKECVNDQGNLTIWTYDQDVTFTIEQVTTEYGIVYDYTHGITIVPYKVNELYKVVYGDGEYYYEEFCHISDTRTTANSDYIAPGKTAFDFTGNLQTGNGSKINPYLAYTVEEFQSFPVGSFIKWLGPGKTVIDATTGQMLIHGEVYRAVEDGDVLQYVILPTLSNPGTAADLAQGKQLIDGEGKVVEGTAGGEIDYTQDVMFWDYDGTLIYACTLEEAKAMTKLPDAPSHVSDGLVFARWNWTLEQLHELTAPVDVGAMYAPADGNSHIFISVDHDNCEFTLWFSGNNTNSNPTVVSINWGDGNTETYSYVSESNKHFDKTHVYSVKGEYEIIIQNISSELTTRYRYSLGYVTLSSVSYGLCGASVNSSGYLNKNYLSSRFTNSLFVKKVYIGDNCSNINITGCIKCSTKVGKYVGLSRGELVENLAIKHINSTSLNSYSMHLSGIETCSFSKNIYLGYSCFRSKNLKRLAIYNDGGTGDYETLSIPSLRFISIAKSFYSKYTGFPGLIFVKKATIGADRADDTNQSSIEELTLSNICASISGNGNFIANSAVKKLIVKNSTPPTLSAAFSNIQPDLKIYVPDDVIDTYKAAKGWKDMADRIYPMSALTN